MGPLVDEQGFAKVVAAVEDAVAKGARVAVGGEKRGKVTDFKEIRGYILVRKPNMLRIIGLYPIVRNKAFDVVSDGQE